MSEPTTRGLLKKAFEETGNGWLLSYWGDQQDEMLDRAVADIEDFAGEYQRRFGDRADPFVLLNTDPYKAKAFFQADTFNVSIDMKIMMWRILLGCEIQEVRFHYRDHQETNFTVVLREPYGGKEEVYQGRLPTDFRVLRHFGAVGTNGRLVLQGYYALK